LEVCLEAVLDNENEGCRYIQTGQGDLIDLERWFSIASDIKYHLPLVEANAIMLL